MSQSVDRLKELLFDSESRALAELERRIKAVADTDTAGHRQLSDDLRRISEAESRERLELAARVEDIFARAGSEERFTNSVASVLEGALRRAEVERHSEVSRAVAPLIVRTIKTEIRNSRDELVEALYPATGRLVKAYVASAMKDLIDEINRRLESNPLMLRLRALMTGRSVAELALAYAQRVSVEEVYLIRRDSGELLQRWPQTAVTSGRDQVLSGVLTAINEFTAEAFEKEGATLRRIDLGAEQVYLRTSPLYLLAARCKGQAHAVIEQVIDSAFLSVIESFDAGLKTEASGAADLLSGIAERLETEIAEKHRQQAVPSLGSKPLLVLLTLIALPLLGWGAWSLFTASERAGVRAVAQGVIEAAPALKGYPIALDVGARGRTLQLTGLAPSPESKDDVIGKLRAALPEADIAAQLTIVPGGLGEVAPEIARLQREIARLHRQAAEVRGEVARAEAQIRGTAIVRAIDRAAWRLEEAMPSLADLAADGPDAAKAATAAATARQVLEKLALLRNELAEAESRGEGYSRLALAFNELKNLLADAADSLARTVTASKRRETPPAKVTESAEELSLSAERLATVTVALAEVRDLERRLPPPTVIPPPTPRERLEAFTRANAIFFTNGTDYRYPERTEALLDKLTTLVREAGVAIRVAGYTDETGGQQRNTPLSQSRAEKVAAALVARGIPPARILTIGREDAARLSRTTGPASPNRRVEIEISFEGETQE